MTQQLNINIVKMALKIAIDKKLEDLLNLGYGAADLTKIIENLDKIRDMKKELEMINKLPASGIVSFSPF